MARKYNGTVTTDEGVELDVSSADMRKLYQLMEEVESASEEMKEAKVAHDMAKAELEAYLADLGAKTITVSSGERSGTATVVTSVTTKYDEARLRKRLGASMWNKVSTRTLDEKKLGAYIKSGEVETSVVAESMTTTPRKPYVRVTF